MAAGEFSVLHQFTTAEGSYPNPLIKGSDGNYYGTAITGGALNWYGTVFRMTPAGAVTVLHSFNGASDGGQPRGTLVDGYDGFYYGIASTGGQYSGGTAFKISATGAFTVLHHFKGGTGEGSAPQCISNGNDGHFYGVAMFDGANDKGTVFKLSRTGVATTIASFNGANGTAPANCLVHTGDGIFYGVTTNGGANNAGVVFKAVPTGGLTAVYSFPGGAGGAWPNGPLEWGTDHNFYGTTQGGGANSYGTVYRVSKAGVATVLYSFTGGADGGAPKGGVTMANNFLFYGNTSYGAAGGNGTTFKINTAGTLTTLHAITAAEGTRPGNHLLRDEATGKLIGATNPGNTGGGAAFRQNP